MAVAEWPLKGLDLASSLGRSAWVSCPVSFLFMLLFREVLKRLKLGSSWPSKNSEDHIHIKVQVWDSGKGQLEGADDRVFS